MSNFIQDEERAIRDQDWLRGVIERNNDQLRSIPRKPMTSTLPAPLPPQPGTEQFICSVEEACADCYGTGRDFYHPGHPQDAGDCSACGGVGRLVVTHNYLAEALSIAANEESTRTITREHLVAIVQYARQMVSATMSLPDVALPKEAA